MYNQIIAKNVIRVSEADAIQKFASLMEHVRGGAEVVIENDARPVAVLHAAEEAGVKTAERIEALPVDSEATIDHDFARDVEAAAESLRQALNPPSWD